MNHLVPDFHDLDQDYSTPGFSRPKKSSTGEEDIMELLWQNGQVVVQSQNQRAPKKSSGGEVLIPTPEREIRSSGEQQQHLFMQEDEMASWLQYSLDEPSFDRDLYADILYSAPPPINPITTVAPPRAVAEIRPPPAPPRQSVPSAAQNQPQNSGRLQNFGYFSSIPGRPRATMRESTVVESNETPLMRPESRALHTAADSSPPQANIESGSAVATSASAGKLAAGTCDLTVTSSPGGSGASFSASEEARSPQHRVTTAAEDRKRKAIEADDNECQSEDIEFEATEAKKTSRGSTSTKRSRAAEVHNLSERRRRDRINEKMKALQELIPRCNKSDKASMLDEAIEYLKSLQMQVQMMSMGCGMVPMMYPGMQQYMPAAMGMGMGMGMDMGMNRPMVPYPSMIPRSAMPNTAHLGSRFPIPPYHMPSIDPSRIQPPNQADHHMLNSGVPHNPNQPRVPNFVDQYHQFLGLHQGQLPLQQNQGVVQPGANKPSSSRDMGNPQNRQPG